MSVCVCWCMKKKLYIYIHVPINYMWWWYAWKRDVYVCKRNHEAASCGCLSQSQKTCKIHDKIHEYNHQLCHETSKLRFIPYHGVVMGPGSLGQKKTSQYWPQKTILRTAKSSCSMVRSFFFIVRYIMNLYIFNYDIMYIYIYHLFPPD